MSFNKKYSDETIKRLASIADDSSYPMPSERLDNLFTIVNTSMLDSIQVRNREITQQANDEQKDRLTTLQQEFVKAVKDDTQNFRNLGLDGKLSHFTQHKLLQVPPSTYQANENLLIFDPHSLEADMDYRELTAPIRRRFEKIHAIFIAKMRSLVKEIEKSINSRGTHGTTNT